MHLKAFFLFLVFSCSIIIAATGKKRDKSCFKLLEAGIQKTVPGIPGARGKTTYRFAGIWEATTYPETVFWRGDNGWLTCSMEKAHKLKAEPNTGNGTTDYSTERVTADKIHKGDTILITPIPGGKFPVPEAVSAEIKNTLFFKTGGSGWLPVAVKKIIKKPDIVQP